MNTFNLVGCIMSEPERGETANGLNLCRIRIAVEKANAKDQANDFEEFEVALFGNLAGQEFMTGQIVAISGRLQANNYEKDAITYHNVRLTANTVSVINV